jgi:indole-3-glycerol phosphate synthase
VLYEYTVHLGLTPLIEIADQEELESIASLNPKLIIINNRNLKTQQVDLNTSRYLISHIDSGTIVICASGIEKGSDIKAMQKLGFQGFLIGTTLMKHHNPGHALKQLLLEANDER